MFYDQDIVSLDRCVRSMEPAPKAPGLGQDECARNCSARALDERGARAAAGCVRQSVAFSWLRQCDRERAISKALPKSQLATLEFTTNAIGDAGAVAISKALPESRCLPRSPARIKNGKVWRVRHERAPNH